MNFNSLDEAEEIFRKSLSKFSHEEKTIILKALDLAKEAHNGQFRDEGPAYIIHPIRVANILINDLGIKDDKVIVAALFHDAVEDTDLTITTIKETFGKRVAEIVKALTRDKNKQTKQEKFEETMKADLDIRSIKACDWLDNIRSWVYIDEDTVKEKLARWIQEEETMYIPLAKTVNIKIVREMEKALDKANTRNK